MAYTLSLRCGKTIRERCQPASFQSRKNSKNPKMILICEIRSETVPRLQLHRVLSLWNVMHASRRCAHVPTQTDVRRCIRISPSKLLSHQICGLKADPFIECNLLVRNHMFCHILKKHTFFHNRLNQSQDQGALSMNPNLKHIGHGRSTTQAETNYENSFSHTTTRSSSCFA